MSLPQNDLVKVASKSGHVNSGLATDKDGRGIVKLLSDSGNITVKR